MELSLLPTKRKKQGPRKKKLKTENVDSSYDQHDSYNGSLLQRAVDTIIYDEEYTPKEPKKKPKKFVESDADHFIFQKLAIPKVMRSAFWKYFGFPADENGDILTKKKTICTLCSSQLRYTGNTTNFKHHVSRKHPDIFDRMVRSGELDPNNRVRITRKGLDSDDLFQLLDVQQLPQNESTYSICVRGENEGEEAIISIPKSHPDVKKRTPQGRSGSRSVVTIVMDYVIRDLQPPSIVNSEGFRHFVADLSPMCEIPTEQSIIQDLVPKMYDNLKNSMYNDISAINMSDGVLSLALEHWKQDDREYISYYINYIQKEEHFTSKLLHTFLLDKENLHDTFYHQEMFNIICTSWNIKTSNIKAVLLSSENEALNQVVVNQEIPVIPCLNHTLDEMCSKAFQMPAIQAVIHKCRSIISQIYNKNNFAIQVTFQDQNAQLDEDNSTFLSMDNPHVWTSTLNMLEAVNAARSKLNVLLEIGDGTMDSGSELTGHMTEDEWYVLGRVVEIFNPIRVTVVTVSEEKPARASLILPLYLQLVNHHLKVHPDDDGITTQLKSYFVKCLTQKYAGVDSFLQICTALDPRFKKLPYIDEQDTFDTAIMSILLAMDPPCTESSDFYSEVAEQEMKKNVRLSGMEFLLGTVSATPSPVKKAPPSHADNVSYEIAQYRRAMPAALNSCPLSWWKSEASRFPNLYALALKYNCIAAVAVPLHSKLDMKERCHYVEKRKSLSLNTQAVLNHLLFLHHNYAA